MEAGSVALGPGTVLIGALNDDAMRQVLHLPEAETPLAVLPVGRPAAV